MDEIKFTAYVTRYALSTGIRQITAVQSGNFHNMVHEEGRRHINYHGEGKDWHRTWNGAVKRAEEMRRAKLASLRKQMKKIEGLTLE